MTTSSPTAPRVSFEFFPPKNEAMEATLWDTIKKLEPLGPRFVSVTYGAGGTTRERTHATVRRIREETPLEPAAHLTCVGATRAEIDEVARDYWNAGIKHIVALRGDAPPDSDGYVPHPGGYAYATDLVEGLRKVGDFEISVAAYPEKHPEASDPGSDMDYLKRKIDAGATRAITQFFFDPDAFFRFIDKARAAGITVPIVPGILPVTNFATVTRFAGMCGARIPRYLVDLFDGLDEDPDTRRMIAATIAAEHCLRIRDQGFDEFHFYTLNRAELTKAVCHRLGIRGASPEAVAKPEHEVV